MNDWAALYARLTGDTCDTGDTYPLDRRLDTPLAASVTSVTSVTPPKWEGLSSALAALARQCPDHVGDADWKLAVEDGRQFLSKWGDIATALGWSTEDLFRLPAVPEPPAGNHRRLSRVGELGLVWLLRGQKVTALTAGRAVIATPSDAVIRTAKYPESIQRGTLTFYRRAHGQ